MRRLGLTSIAALSLLLVAPAAQAQVQAQTERGQHVRLNVRDSNGLRCLSVAIGQESATRTAPCAAPPATAQADATGVRVVYRATPEKLTIVYGTLSPETARLQLRFADDRLLTLEPQGEQRAYLAVFTGRPALASTRAVGPDGRDRAAADLDPRALRLRPRRGPITMRKLFDERGNQARFEAFTSPVLPPGALRRRSATCVSVGARNAVPRSGIEPGYAGGSACQFDRSRIVVKYAKGCSGASRLLLFGLGPSEVRRYEVVTQQGARRRLVTSLLPRELRRPRRRAFIFSGFDLGPLDRLEAYARSGRRLASLPLAAIGSGCVSSSRS